MIIECPKCNKKFQIDQNLIPINGRTLQCGSCDHKWFFKFENKKKEEKEEIQIDEKISDFQKNTNFEDNIVENENKNINSKENKLKVNNLNYFKILIVAFISFAALILVLDTFKVQISVIIPNIQIILDNLYQSINDMKLFIIDLVK